MAIPYDARMAEQTLVLVTGLQGTGKSATADSAGRLLTAPVIAHDWAMSGLRPFPEVQSALDEMGPQGHRDVGWSLLFALGRSQLRRGISVVLDGVARAAQVQKCAQIAAEERARMVLILTTCSDLVLHRSRIESRRRNIPNWYELEWEHVERVRAEWEPPSSPDLIVDAVAPLEDNARALDELLRPPRAGASG
jgi:predicted kinase